MQTVHLSNELGASRRIGLKGRSALIRSDFNRGVKWAFDISRIYSYDGTTPVVNGAVVRNLAEAFTERDNPPDAGDVVIGAGGAPTYGTGGMDFTPVSAHGTYIRGPATAAAAIWDNGQYYLSVTCLKLPTSADWSESTGLAPIQAWTAASNGYAANLDIATTGFAKYSTVPGIGHYRQYGASFLFDTTAVIAPSGAFGKFAMVASWFKAGEVGISLTTEYGTVTDTTAPTGNNSNSFAALRPMRGIVSNLWTAQIANNAQKWKLYSGFDEAIGLSGRSVSAVLAEHWAREKAKWDAGIYA